MVRSFPVRLVGEDHLLAELSGHSFHPQRPRPFHPGGLLCPADPSNPTWIILDPAEPINSNQHQSASISINQSFQPVWPSIVGQIWTTGVGICIPQDYFRIWHIPNISTWDCHSIIPGKGWTQTVVPLCAPVRIALRGKALDLLPGLPRIKTFGYHRFRRFLVLTIQWLGYSILTAIWTYATEFW